MTRAFIIFALLGSALGQVTITGSITTSGVSISAGFQAISIDVLPAGIGVPVGGTASFSAIFTDGLGNTEQACASSGWSSSAPGIATINASTGVATGVSVGTAIISCTASGLSDTSTLVVEIAPSFSNPATPCTGPCVLSSGTQSAAYSNTLTASGGTPAYTYSLTIGSLPTGLSLSGGGVISGTPSGTGTSTFTVKVCDSLSTCTSQQMSLTILSAVGCTTTGPPTYTCASTSLADTTTPLTTIFTTTSPTPTTCSGACQNAIAEDTQEPGHVAGTYKYTRISDRVSLNGKSVQNFTTSGGDNNRIFSYPTGQFLYVTGGLGTQVYELSVVSIGTITGSVTSGTIGVGDTLTQAVTAATCSVVSPAPTGSINLLVKSCSGAPDNSHVWTDGTTSGTYTPTSAPTFVNAFQVVNTGANVPIVRGTGLETSWLTETRFYHFSSTANGLFQGDLTGLVGGHIVNGTTSYTDTLLFDFFAAGNCPGGISFPVVWKSDIGVSDNDDTFAVSIGPTGGQGHSDTTFAYSKTKGVAGGPGCAVINFHTGQMWGFTACSPGSCTGSESPTFTFSNVSTQCWGSQGSSGLGIHNSQGSGDGNFVVVSRGNGWTKGGCVAPNTGEVIVNWNSGLNQWCNSVGLQCAGHNSAGISHGLYTYWASGFTTRAFSDVTTYTLFFPSPNVADEHCAWPHNNSGTFDDTLYWFCAGDAVGSFSGEGTVYLPKYLNNEVWIINPAGSTSQLPLRFGHTFSCNNLGSKCTSGVYDGFGPGNAIGMARPKGDGFCFASSMLQSLGNDISGGAGADAFCIYMGN